MTVMDTDPRVSPEEFTEHVERYVGFERMVLFSTLHIVLALVCLALAFIGHIPVLAFLLFLGGSLTTITAFAIYT